MLNMKFSICRYNVDIKKWVQITYEAFMDYRVGGTEVSAKEKLLLKSL